jgi:hypothetical protein
MASILTLKKKIGEIKGYLKESKSLEEQYAAMEKQMYRQQDDLLDDDEELFV